MKHHARYSYLAILAIAVVGFLTFGVPVPALAYAALALVCPLIMIFTPGSGDPKTSGSDTRSYAVVSTAYRPTVRSSEGEHSLVSRVQPCS